MVTTGNEKYLRSILLLTEGGLYISKKVLSRAVAAGDVDLNSLLKQFDGKLRHQLHKKQYEKLFPSSGKADVDTWDLQTVIIVTQVLFRQTLTLETRSKLQVLTSLRNDVQAHRKSASLDEEEYADIKEQLTDVITTLASGFDERTQTKCFHYIKMCESEPLDVKSSIQIMQKLQDNDEMFHEVLNSIRNSRDETCEKIDATGLTVTNSIKATENKLLEKLNRLTLDEHQMTVKVGIHPELKIAGASPEMLHLMYTTLCSILNEADKTSGGEFAALKENVKGLLDKIKEKSTFKGAEVRCILLKLECSSYKNVLELLNFFSSKEYSDRLNNIANALMASFNTDDQVTISSYIPITCLQTIIGNIDTDIEEMSAIRECGTALAHGNADIFAEMDPEVTDIEEMSAIGECRTALAHGRKSKGKSELGDKHTATLMLSLDCCSYQQLKDVWHLFHNHGAKDQLNKIADALSKQFGQKDVSLTAHLNLDEFEISLDEAVRNTPRGFHHFAKILPATLQTRQEREMYVSSGYESDSGSGTHSDRLYLEMNEDVKDWIDKAERLQKDIEKKLSDKELLPKINEAMKRTRGLENMNKLIVDMEKILGKERLQKCKPDLVALWQYNTALQRYEDK